MAKEQHKYSTAGGAHRKRTTDSRGSSSATRSSASSGAPRRDASNVAPKFKAPPKSSAPSTPDFLKSYPKSPYERRYSEGPADPSRRDRATSEPRRNLSTRPDATPGYSHSRRTPRAHGRNPVAVNTSFLEKLTSSKPVLIAILAAVALLLFGLLDLAGNWGRAYGNISINGISVSGMNSSEMEEMLKKEFGSRVSHAQVGIYPSEEGKAQAQAALDAARASAASGSVIPSDLNLTTDYWLTDALALKANVPYKEAIDKAIAVGREDGGVFSRIGLTFNPVDIYLGVYYDPAALEALAAEIDKTMGDPRRDTTVQIVNAWATPVEGHDGTMVDRGWLAQKLAWAMMREQSPSSVVAEVTPAPSRITMAQAEELCDQLNHALGCEALFTYKNNEWQATDIDLGNWTRVETVPDGAGYKLAVSLDSAKAIPMVTKGARAFLTSLNSSVYFEKSGNDTIVYTGGDGLLPEVPVAIDALEAALYGPEGIAWSKEKPYVIPIEIGETDKPEKLTFDQAINSEIITVIGEFTTEFSNYVGTENRNHNIKLAADVINDKIVKGSGGIWSFNDEAGDTTEEAGYWSAGTIVDGEITDSIGGGICQVATTVFNAVYEAGLDIPERHNHTMYLANYPDGRDSGINYPDLDLVWRNNMKSDVLLRMSYTDTSITAKLYSVYTGYKVETKAGEWIEGEKYKRRYNEDPALAKDTYRKKTGGEDGRKITVTRTVKDRDGKVIYQDNFFSDYDPKDEIYLVGPETDTKALERYLKEIQDKKEKTPESGTVPKGETTNEAPKPEAQGDSSAEEVKTLGAQ